MSKAISKVRPCALIEFLELRRLLSSGSLDPNFGGTGVVDIPETNGLSFNATATAVQSDGKIVIAGTTSDHRVAVARFNVNGTLDATFGTGGESLFHFANHHDVGKSVAIQSDGKILVAGADNANDGGALDSPVSSSQLAVARLTASGALDSTFGDAGVFTININNFLSQNQPALANNVIVTPQGGVLLTGTLLPDSITSDHFSTDFISLLLDSSGKLNQTYGTKGIEQLDLSGSDANLDDDAFASALDLSGTAQSNPNYGKLVIVGDNNTGAVQKIAIARLNLNGTPDTTFRHDGTFITAFRSGFKHSIARSVVITPDDDIVVAGQVSVGSGAPDFGLMAFKSDGTLDTNFGFSGTIDTDFGQKSDSAASIVIGQTSDFIVGGTSGGKLAIAAYTPAGKLDTHFGNAGKVTSTEPAIRQLVTGLAGTLVTTSAINSTTERFFDVEPLDAIGSLNSSASEQGTTTATFLVTQSMTLDYDRKIYLHIGGSAIAPSVATIKLKTADYTLNGVVLTLKIGSTPYVLIPAHQSSALVTLTPIDDTRVEGDETAIFSIVPNAAYDIDPNEASTTLTIHDNDGPVTTACDATADTYVRDGSNATVNFGTTQALDVKKGATGQNRQAYVKFDLSTLTSVTSVVLQLNGELKNTGSNIATQVFGVSDNSWKETGITFKKKRAPAGGALGTIVVADQTLQLYTLDVTAYVKAQLAAGKKIVSFLLQTSVSPAPMVAFSSRESGSGPQLLVT